MADDALFEEWKSRVEEASELEVRAYCRAPLILETLRWIGFEAQAVEIVDASAQLGEGE